MNPNLTPAASFTYKDLLLRKLYYSVMYSVLSQLIVLQIYVFFVNVNITSPVDWLKAAFNTYISPSTWLFIIPFISIVFAQSIICAKDYVFKATFCSTRFQKFIQVLSIHNLILLLFHMLIGGIQVWIFLSLGQGPYQNLIVNCHDKRYCLMEGTFFLVFSGLWTGMYFFIKFYINEKQLMFPVVQQSKLIQFKSIVMPTIKECLSLAVWPSTCFVILYYFWGKSTSKTVRNLLRFEINEKEDSTILIFVYLWLFTALYYFTMNLMRFFFNLFLTEPVEFQLNKQDNCLTLQEAINMPHLPIVQNLACLDLANLAKWSLIRRQVLFQLSLPGNHPHNWNFLVDNVLKLFNEYTELLNRTLDSPQKTVTSVPTPCSPQITKNKYQNLRNMSMNLMDENFVDVNTKSLPNINFFEPILMKLKQKLQNIWNIFKILFGINYFFGELPQANIQKCLANGQLIIWCSQSITDLICASLTEDRYGIAQKDLQIIITTLVNLKSSLEKLNKLSSLTRRDDFNYKMKNSVYLSVKRCLFRISYVFNEYLDSLRLSNDVLQQLQIYNRL